MQQPTSDALGLTANQIVINIGPDPRLRPSPVESRKPVFIRLGPGPSSDVARPPPNASQVPVVPVTVRFTAPKQSRQHRRVPPTPIDVPQVISETSSGSIPKIDLLTPHPTVIPSPFMETVRTPGSGRTAPPTIIRLPKFDPSQPKAEIDPTRVPTTVRATARMPLTRPARKKTVIRVPDERPPTPIIVRVQSPLGTPRALNQNLPARSVTVRIQSPEPGLRSPSRVFARVKQEGSVGK
ncbi:hypothetical protein M407DRAFT_27557 [Tulasnella calospora MUT 4182]|uniref:Uncharacterized protein n=1 Tax=Tulasnella calospora MUT 4182 TaxID=1051891 RepID=A0A0C3Q2W7_9AGAM|nr:hypothetical protein M407DRAFT_27557 [Tulasnella calospora MUT 4182]